MNIVKAANFARQALEHAKSSGQTVQVYTEAGEKVNVLEELEKALKTKPVSISRVDWPLLRKQKLALMNAYGKLTHDQQEALDGIVNLIDSLQDSAVECGVPENEVFHVKD